MNFVVRDRLLGWLDMIIHMHYKILHCTVFLLLSLSQLKFTYNESTHLSFVNRKVIKVSGKKKLIKGPIIPLGHETRNLRHKLPAVSYKNKSLIEIHQSSSSSGAYLSFTSVPKHYLSNSKPLHVLSPTPILRPLQIQARSVFGA